MTDFPLRCRCGLMSGRLTSLHRACRAVCYCKDCQAFARFLGRPEVTLNSRGGTDVVATSPRHVRFVQGMEHLRCMSLSERGILRWYAGCCRTPIGNTLRDPRLSYVSLIHEFLAGSPRERDAAFGPARVAAHAGSATGHVDPTPWATFLVLLQVIRNVAGARLGGGYRVNPFFRAGTAEPVVAPQVLPPAERRALRGDA